MAASGGGRGVGVGDHPPPSFVAGAPLLLGSAVWAPWGHRVRRPRFGALRRLRRAARPCHRPPQAGPRPGSRHSSSPASSWCRRWSWGMGQLVIASTLGRGPGCSRAHQI